MSEIMHIRFLLCLVLCILASPGEPGLAQASKDAVPTSTAQEPDYSNDPVIFERRVARVVYEADGLGTSEIEEVIRVQTEAGLQFCAVVPFSYDSANESVEVEYVRVKKPDGSVVVTPESNIEDVLSDATRQAPVYSDRREKHVVVKALGVGDTLEYRVRYRRLKPQVPGQFWYQRRFSHTVIAKDDELQINVAHDQYLKVSSPGFSPQVKEEAGRRIYSWKTANLNHDLDPNTLENDLPPSVQITTFRSWEEVGHWYSDLERPQQASTPPIRAKAAELTRGLRSDEEKIRALYKFVSTRFHYVSLSFGIGRYQPHTADEVLSNGYGDCKDKHTLLAALLQAAGYDSWPALVNASGKIDPEVPSPGQFDHLITVVPRGHELLWLDSTPEVSPFGFLTSPMRDKQALVMPSGKPAFLMKTPAHAPFPTSATINIEGKLSPEGTLRVHFRVATRGDEEFQLRSAFRETPWAEWKNLVQEMMRRGYPGEVNDINVLPALDDTEKPFEYEYDYTCKNYSDWENRRIAVPFAAYGVEPIDDEAKAKPVHVVLSDIVEYHATIELPSGYSPVLPQDVHAVQDFAEYHSTYAVENGKLIADRRLITKKEWVPVADWENYLNFGKAITYDESRFIVLNRRSGNDGSKNKPQP